MQVFAHMRPSLVLRRPSHQKLEVEAGFWFDGCACPPVAAGKRCGATTSDALGEPVASRGAA